MVLCWIMWIEGVLGNWFVIFEKGWFSELRWVEFWSYPTGCGLSVWLLVC